MDTYIVNQLAAAKELLESGIQLNNPSLIIKSMNIYDNMHNIIKNNEEYNKNVTENMVRATSAMCVFDPRNAKSYLDHGNKYDDEHVVINNNYGFVYHQLGEWDKSIQHYEKCLFKDDTYDTAYLGIINVYRTLRHHKVELEYCKKAVIKCPNSPELLNSLGLALLHNQQYGDIHIMFSQFEKALTLKPSSETKSKIFVNIGHLHGITGEFSQAIIYYLKALESDPKHQPAYQNILLNLHYYSDNDFNDYALKAVMNKFNVTRNKGETIADVIKKLHVAIVNVVYKDTIYNTIKNHLKKSTGSKNISKDTDITRKIVLGYISADLVDHAVSYFSNVLFSHYNPDCFDVYIYANNVYDPESISKLKYTGYRCIQNASATDVVEQIQKDDVDILIDLSSHTAGNRLDVIALKPAPIILSYVGYPADTGFPYVRRISDEYTERCNKDKYEHGVITAPIQLSRLFLCYTPKQTYEHAVKSFANFSPNRSIINFGCFGKLQKINKHVIETWKEILRQVPNARLILKSRYFQDKKVLETWKNKFGDMVNRIVFLKLSVSTDQHMEMFKLIDIHLDTFPYSGTTITTESLYMNVPVVTLALYARSVGHVSRVSGSILHSIGLEEDCVAKNVTEYVEKAVRLVKKLPNLPSVRKRFLSTVISNKHDFMKHYEKAICDVFIESL
jgi:predicted O-linked N-acetylglucosamine transferase (SPINDLY family)